MTDAVLTLLPYLAVAVAALQVALRREYDEKVHITTCMCIKY
jgi:hypothetical protein